MTRIIHVEVRCSFCGAQEKDVSAKDVKLTVNSFPTVLIDLCSSCEDQLMGAVESGVTVQVNGKTPRKTTPRKPKRKEGYPYPGMTVGPAPSWKCSCGRSYRTARGRQQHMTRGGSAHEPAD